MSKKIELAKLIVNKAKELAAEFGKPSKIACKGRSDIQYSHTVIDKFNILMITPFSRVKTGHGDFNYQVDIYHKDLGKIFGASWHPQKKWANKFECFRLIKGEWIDEFLSSNTTSIEV